jgi:hypothetical protein
MKVANSLVCGERRFAPVDPRTLEAGDAPDDSRVLSTIDMARKYGSGRELLP